MYNGAMLVVATAAANISTLSILTRCRLMTHRRVCRNDLTKIDPDFDFALKSILGGYM